MSSEQKRFYQFIESNYPALSRYWDTRTDECDLEAVNRDLGVLSKGESVILTALVAMWTRDDRQYPVGFTDLAALSDDAKDPLLNLLATPIWP
jgi:hypothetical protein